MEKLGPRFEAARLALMQRGLTTTAVVRAIPGSPFALVSVAAGASDIRFLDYLIGTAIGIMVPVSVMTVASDQAFRLLAEPNFMHFAVLAGVLALWFAIAFGAQALVQRIAKNRSRVLIDPPLVALPVGLAQLALEELAAGVARQLVDEIDRARALVAGKLVARPVDQALLGQAGAGALARRRL